MLIGIAVALLLIWLLLIAALATGRPRGKMLQLSAAYRRFSPSRTQPDPNRRLRPKLVVLAVLVVLNVVWLGLLLSRVPGGQAVESTSIQSATPGGKSSSAGTSRPKRSAVASAASRARIAPARWVSRMHDARRERAASSSPD